MALNNTASGDQKFLLRITRAPMLEKGEDKILADAWKNHGDLAAYHRLIESHMRLVMKISAGYARRYGLALADLIDEGNIGLMEAVKGFQSDRGVTFGAYARWWIRANLQIYILKNSSVISFALNVEMKGLFFNLRRAKARLGIIDDLAAHPKEALHLAEMLNSSLKQIMNAESWLKGDVSLNAPAYNKDGEDCGEKQDFLVSSEPDFTDVFADADEAQQKRACLIEALKVVRLSLTHREMDVLMQRRKECPATLEELSVQYNVSRERIRQIEIKAFGRLREVTLAIFRQRGITAPAVKKKSGENPADVADAIGKSAREIAGHALPEKTSPSPTHTQSRRRRLIRQPNRDRATAG